MAMEANITQHGLRAVSQATSPKENHEAIDPEKQ